MDQGRLEFEPLIWGGVEGMVLDRSQAGEDSLVKNILISLNDEFNPFIDRL